MSTLRRRALGPVDEATLRAFWARQPEAHIFAIPDLDHFGWWHPQLDYTGWFEDERLVGYLMRYGTSAQWAFDEPAPATEVARMLENRGTRFVSGLEAQLRPILEALPAGVLQREEPSTVAMLPLGSFRPESMRAGPGRARRATHEDLDALAELHVAAPDQFNDFGFALRRRVLSYVLDDGWRRIYLVECDGAVVAAAQTNAEGERLVVVGGVVTHPDHRGRGHATQVTAHLCAALDEEEKIPYLYFRRDNRPAARVYEKIGFVGRGDALLAELEWQV